MNKTSLFFLLLFSSARLIAQDSTAVKLASVHAMTSNKYLTLFCGYNSYTVLGDMQLYLQHNLSCKTYGKDTFQLLKDSSTVFTTGYLNNTPNEVHEPIYLTSWSDKKGIIQHVKISGDYVDITLLFLFYWPTKISAAEIKQKKAAVSYLYNDKIVYQSFNNQAAISITHL